MKREEGREKDEIIKRREKREKKREEGREKRKGRDLLLRAFLITLKNDLLSLVQKST